MNVTKFENLVAFCTSLVLLFLLNGLGTVQVLLLSLALVHQEVNCSRGGVCGLEGLSEGLTQGGLLIPWLVSSMKSFHGEDNTHVDLGATILVSNWISLFRLHKSNPSHSFKSVILHAMSICSILIDFDTKIVNSSFVVLALLVFYSGMRFLSSSFTVGEMIVCAQLVSYVIVCSFINPSHSTEAGFEIVYIVPRLIAIFLALSFVFCLLIRQYTTAKSRSLMCIAPSVLCLGFLLRLLVPMVYEMMLYGIGTTTRARLLGYWTVVLVIGIGITKAIKVKTIIVRKCFHFLAVLLFLPAQIYDISLLQLSLALAFGCFSIIEGIRLASIPYISQKIDEFLGGFVDHRDKGPLIFSHFSLLLGLALPIWITSTLPSGGGGGVDSNKLHVLSMSGLVSLGIGDSFAAIIGTKYGRIHLVKGIDKTIEGSIACFVSCMITWWIISCFTLITLRALFLPTIIAAVFEATSSQNDNLFLPLYYYSILLNV